MKKCVMASLSILALVAMPLPAHADDYTLDPAHTSAVFKIEHLGVSWTYGRFNDVGGQFTLDPADASRSSFSLTLKTDSIDTNNPKRDGHLKSPDFFNAKQFPLISFKSTSVKPVAGGYDVQGNLTMHGVTRPITLSLRGGKTVDFPKGKQRTGFSTDLVLHRSEFGMDRMVGPVGDDVYIAVSFEGSKK